jgi:UDP-N-acetylmuramoyl-tripeptide--D-alanyl-D-alanine ligase
MNQLLNFSIIQELTEGEWLTVPDDSTRFLRGGAFDTRNLGEAEIFFAWKGENSDGHRYLEQLKKTRISLAIVEQEVVPVEGLAILKVDSSLQALHKLARWLIQHYEGKLVSITGSSGKTTAKSWLNHIVTDYFKLLSNTGSFNNQIGCPITILNLKPDTDLVILEMGTSGLGELELLSSIAPADISILLNVGHAHLGKFGSRAQIYKAKNEIFSHLKKDGLALIPEHDPKIKKLLKHPHKLCFGAGADIFNWKKGEAGKIKFGTNEGVKEVLVNVIGPHVGEVLSGLIAICFQLKLNWQDIEARLHNLPQEKGRGKFLEGKMGSVLLDDTYNANPESVINMLETICQLEKEQYIGIVGNLAEMDDNLEQSAEVILANIPTKLTHLFIGGETGRFLFKSISSRYPKLKLFLIDQLDTALKELEEIISSQTVVGVKGSRSSHMERFLYLLQGKSCNCLLQYCPKLMMCQECEQL